MLLQHAAIICNPSKSSEWPWDHGRVWHSDIVTIATITVYVGSFMPTRTSTAWRPQGSETAIDCRSLVLLVLLSCQTALVIRLRLVGFWWGLFMLWLMLGRCLSDIHSTATDLKSKCQCKVMHHPGHPVHYISVILRFEISTQQSSHALWSSNLSTWPSHWPHSKVNKRGHSVSFRDIHDIHDMFWKISNTR